jgi:hypothetical protein
MGEADNEPGEKDDDKSPPWDTDDKEKSQFKKPNNPNRTGQDSAKALAQRGMQSKMNVQELTQGVYIIKISDEKGLLIDSQPFGIIRK